MIYLFKMKTIRRNIAILTIAAFALVSMPKEAHAGAWTLPQGYRYIEWLNKYYFDKRSYNEKRRKTLKPNDGKYGEWRSELKFEYGITDNLNFTLYAPYKAAWYKDINGKAHNASFEDTWIGFKYRVFVEPMVTSVWFRLKVPGGYDPHDAPQLGAKQFDAEIKLMAAKAFKSPNSYVGAEIGFRGRAEEPANEIPYFLEGGLNLTDSILFKAALDGLRSLPGTGSIPGEDYLKFTVGPSFSLNGGFGSIYRNKASSELELGYGRVIYGKNTGAGQEVFAKLISEF